MRVLAAALFFNICSLAGQQAKSWTGPFQTCTSGADVLKYDSMNLGVHFATSNAKLSTQFENAMNFWASVIDMRWHAESSSRCSLQLFDGQSELFEDSTVAKAHPVEVNEFSAWVAFNPKAPLTNQELYLTAVHEIGHLLGLRHNPNIFSVMYYTNGVEATLLDQTDLRALSELHKLRIAGSRTIRCTGARATMSSAGALAWPRRKLFLILHQPEPTRISLHFNDN
jgi:hypothetical protein